MPTKQLSIKPSRSQRKAEIRDKNCPDCGVFIMRKSSYCKGCSQKGSRSINFRHGKFKCEGCGIEKKHPKLCWDCYQKMHVGNNHPMFKETGYTYSALHDWVKRHRGRPWYCSSDSSHLGPFVWANISGQYYRDLKDFQSLCNSCNFKDGVRVHERFHKELGIYGK